ncbi:MAG TPA: sigma-70 family RNA polymerase sigma factor [Bacteroidales bacterium]|jgi:RNA polymerase sigma-70 factor (ECF subfamily)|nr:RNA polymerase subunit sigma-70 [Bacteroidota bacterium]HJN06785.1 sigma-70 family RNA polymerase sigma factor [Bacteroidales bacterium]|tara:strand:+ start:1062 stop:1631 length:570 start_codon:yes stop_codon:yes gene_type:complete
MPVEYKIFIDKARNGDKEAFGHLVKAHQQYAFNLAFRIVCNEEEARDVVQDSFIKIWKNIKLYNPDIKFTTWMYNIVTNTAIDYLRATKKVDLVNIDDFHEKLTKVSTDNPETKLYNQEIGQLIHSISDTLPEKQRLVFVLRDLQGMNSAETSDVLDLSITSVKSNLYLARRVIKEKLLKILSYEGRTI